MPRKKTAQFIEEKKAIDSPERSGKKKGIGRGKHPNSRKGDANLAAHQWPKGTSGNPGGLPGTDLAAVIARRVFEEFKEEIAAGVRKQLKDGNAYAFSVMADRGYGKVKDRMEVTGSDGEPLNLTIRVVGANGKLKEMK